MKDIKDQILKILFENSTGILEGLKYGTAASEIESLIKENFVEKERHDILVKYADDLLLNLKEQKRIYFECFKKQGYSRN